MSQPPADYIQSIAYPDHFHPEQAPVWTAAVMAALGHVTPGRRGTTWCEIGCGQGFVATLLAATNPDMQFYGFDINPAHIDVAKARAKAAGLTNIRFDCADIRDIDHVGQAYDFITCFGVMSWVNPEVRAQIIAFIGRHLSPQGVATLHYMSDPGGAMLKGFHSVFRALAAHPDPIGAGFAQLEAMRTAQAGFFQLHSAASDALESLKAERPAYIAHEYLNPQFTPLAFHEVYAAMQGQGLEWRGSATPIENIDAISLPEAARLAMTEVIQEPLRETLKDLARNQTRRIDLFTRPRGALEAKAHLDLLDSFIWGLMPNAALPSDGVLPTAIGQVTLAPEILAALMQALRQGPSTFLRLAQLPAFNGRAALLNQALQTLLWAGIAHPVFPGFTLKPAAQLNAELARRALQGEDVPALAAAVTASGRGFSAGGIAALMRHPRPAEMVLFGLPIVQANN